MVLVLQEKPNPAQDRTEAMIRNISSRNAGGRTTVADLSSVGQHGPSRSTYQSAIGCRRFARIPIVTARSITRQQNPRATQDAHCGRLRTQPRYGS